MIYFWLQGVLFSLYPLVGHLTDVYLTRYRSLKWSFGILISVICVTFVCFGIDTAIENTSDAIHESRTYWLAIRIPIAMVCLLYFIGLGLFQANAIQFGLDQLLEAPTPKLIAFIHWYYWAQNVGSLALFYTNW